MRRSTAVLLAMAVIAATLGFASTAAAVDSAPAPTASPANPLVDETFIISGNIGTTGSRAVELQRLNSGSWEKYKSSSTDSSGNYSFSTHTSSPTRTYRVHAPATSSKPAVDTEPLNVSTTPNSGGGAPTTPVATPSSPLAGQSFTITGNIGSTGSRSVTLQRLNSGTWGSYKSGTTTSSGNYSFTATTSEPTRTYRVFAPATSSKPSVTSPELTVTTIQPPKASLHIQRDCTGNDCANTATATGVLDPVQQGRVFTLQRLSGSSWVSVSGANPQTTDANGKVQIQFDVTSPGVPQWTNRTYRLISLADASNPGVISPSITFMPGPTTLGANVLRVDVDGGAYPTSKSKEYTGKATASVNGVVNPVIDHVALQKFGVRGTSTATYTKKPYKLKFDKSPKSTTVFGMDADKSWTLLASYLDQSFVRDKVGLDLGRRIAGPIPWTPDSRFVELFVNDQYRGSYLMTESVKIDGDRINVDPRTGMEMEVDNTVSSSSIGFYSSKGIPIIFKDPDERKTLADGSPDPEGVTSDKLSAIKSRVNAFESKLYSSSTRSQYTDYLDEAAAIDFQFIKEFTKDNDGDFNSSHYFAWDQVIDPTNPLRDRKFHFGPAWDFDRSAGNVDPDTAGHAYIASPQGWILRGTGTPSDSGRQLYKTHWFVQLFKDAGFNAAVKSRWQVIKDEFRKVGDSEVAQLKTDIGIGASNDRNRWASEPKRYRSHGSYDGEIAFVTKWYTDRYNWMNGQLS